MASRALGVAQLSFTAVAIACAIAAAPGCIALVCFDTDPCARGSGGASTGTASTASLTTSTASTMTTSTSSAMTTSSSTGGACADPIGCNGVDCLGGTCANCVCDPVALDFGVPVGRLAATGTSVFVAAGTNGSAKLYGVPKTFDSAASVATFSLSNIPDAQGFVAGSGTKVAYSPQTDGRLVLCEAGTCKSSTQAFDAHATGLAFDLNSLTFGVGPSTNGVGTYASFSTNPPNILVLLNDSPPTGSGVHTVRIESQVIYWSDLDGCLYAVKEGNAGGVSCLSLNGPALHTADFVVGPFLPQPVFLAQTSGGEIIKVDANVITGNGVATFIPDTNQLSIKGTGPLAVDPEKRLFVAGPSGIAAYAYKPSGSTLLVNLSVPDAVVGMDGTDNNALYFTAGTKLYRWAKPKP